MIGGSLLIYALRAPKVAGGEPFAAVSRETALLINNLMFVCAAAMVLLGTLYPLLGEALNLGRISVGPPYFGFMFVLLMLPVVLLVPFGPFLRWRSGRLACGARQAEAGALWRDRRRGRCGDHRAHRRRWTCRSRRSSARRRRSGSGSASRSTR